MKNVKAFALILPGFAIAILLAGCGSQGAYQQPVVTMGTTPAIVQPGATAMLSASVTNDSSNMGVNWIVSCPRTPCGSVSPANTASGASTTYSAPAVPPAGDLTVTITATAAAGGSIPASANFQVPGITVTVSAPSVTMLPLNGTAQVTATVTGDPAAQPAVTWSVSCAVTACGSVAPSTTGSGVATTYTAPAIPPAGNLVVTITAASVTNAAVSGSTTVTIIGITISIAPPSASVDSAGTQSFTATVNNDPSNGGVTWSLQITQLVCLPFPLRRCHNVTSVCPTVCGSFSPASTASVASTTYTAPNSPPRGAVAAVATSVTNTGARGTANITILGISVSVSPSTATIAVNGTQSFTATVTNDGANGGAGAGVAWTLEQNGVACSPGCGTLSAPNSAIGVPVTYTAPATVPAYPILTVIAHSVTDTTKLQYATVTVTTPSGAPCGAGSGGESLLNGQYAFRVQSPNAVTIAGSFKADGTGKITAGEQDFNASSAQTLDITKSLYSVDVGSDHRGCLAVAITGGGTSYYRFALGSINSGNIATAGHIMEFDDTTGTGQRVTGTIRLQDATSFAAGKFKGNYVIGLIGVNGALIRSAIAGTFTSDGISAITASNLDINDAGTITSNLASAPGGSFTCCDTNGRGTLQLATPTGLANSLILYMISSNEAFIANSGTPTYSGEAIAVPAMTTFAQTSLNGSAVIRKTAQTPAGPLVDIALASANGTGGISITDKTNNAGTFSSATTPFTYTVASSGRVTLTGGASPPVVYLYGPNAGFLVGTDANVEFGIIEPQAGGPFSGGNASLSGGYMFGTENPSASTAALETGVATLDGAGNVTGTSDQAGPTGLTQNQNVSLTYSVAADGTGTFGTGTTAILISGSKLVFINNTSTATTITVVEK
jgi:hypothetical protein